MELTGYLCGGLFLLGVIALIVRRVLNPPAPPGRADRPPPRSAAAPPAGPTPAAPPRPAEPAVPAPLPLVRRREKDGFWFNDPALPRGTRIRYRCRVKNRPRFGEFDYSPGPDGQFIFTAGEPADVEVEVVRPPLEVTDTTTSSSSLFDSDAEERRRRAAGPGLLIRSAGESSSGVGGGFDDAPVSDPRPGAESTSDTTSSPESGAGGSFDPPAY